jgi:hypothetical protein
MTRRFGSRKDSDTLLSEARKAGSTRAQANQGDGFMALDVSAAQAFVSSLAIPSPRFGATATAVEFDFDAARSQAMVVGSEVVSFVTGVNEDERSDIINAALLAQLRAKKVVPEPARIADLRTWYQQYFDVLSNVGFVTQQTNMQKYHVKTDGFQAHEAVLEVAATLLAGSPTALAVLTSTVKALQKMDQSTPWLTIFDRESRSANTAHFQVSTVDRDPTGDLFIAMMAFGLEATSKVSQVLFFKFHSNETKIENNAGKATINAMVLEALRPTISQKLIAHSADFVGQLEI